MPETMNTKRAVRFSTMVGLDKKCIIITMTTPYFNICGHQWFIWRPQCQFYRLRYRVAELKLRPSNARLTAANIKIRYGYRLNMRGDNSIFLFYVLNCLCFLSTWLLSLECQKTSFDIKLFLTSKFLLISLKQW